jgi:hypothetical protein
MDGLFGVIAIDARVAEVTVRVAGGLVIPPSEAVMLVEPDARAEAKPDPLMVATPVFEEAQVAVEVRLAVLPSL